MGKTVVTFGLISGGVLSALMAATVPFQEDIPYDKAMVIGYTTMVIAGLLIYFGIRSYRDNVGGGSIGFGRAFAIGALIALISSACYTATWEVIYFNFEHDFMTKYQAREINSMKAKGATQAEIDKRTADLKKYAEMYENPAINSAMTMMEPLPVGLLITLVSAGVLSRRKKQPGLATA
jgi:hypothetical protein